MLLNFWPKNVSKFKIQSMWCITRKHRQKCFKTVNYNGTVVSNSVMLALERGWRVVDAVRVACARGFSAGKMIYIVCVAAGGARGWARFLKQIQSTADMAEYYY